MTEEEAQREYEIFMEKLAAEEEETYARARKEGKLKLGIDGNKEIFRPFKEKWWSKVQELRTQID